MTSKSKSINWLIINSYVILFSGLFKISYFTCMAGNAMIGCERVGLKVFTTAIISVAAVMVHSVPLPPFVTVST